MIVGVHEENRFRVLGLWPCLLFNGQERFYFGDAVLPLFESGIPLLLKRLRSLPDKDNVGNCWYKLLIFISHDLSSQHYMKARSLVKSITGNLSFLLWLVCLNSIWHLCDSCMSNTSIPTDHNCLPWRGCPQTFPSCFQSRGIPGSHMYQGARQILRTYVWTFKPPRLSLIHMMEFQDEKTAMRIV
jgi:hypothetical protein